MMIAMMQISHHSLEIEASNHKTTHLYVSFFYDIVGDKMYIELIIIFNIYIDFLLLLMTSLLVKRRIKLKNLIISSILGGISSIILFLNISILKLLITSFIISLIIVKIAFATFKFLPCFYLNSIILGGLIFFLNNYLNLTVFGNYISLFLITPIILAIYKNKVKDLRENYNLNYQVIINYKGKKIILNSFLDTGNTLIDPYFKRPVILINDDILKSDKYFYIPYSTITESGIIKAIYLKEIEIIGFKKVNNVVIGLLPEKLKLNKIDCLLNNKLLEEYYA